MKALVKYLAKVLIHYVYGIPLIHQRENGHLLSEWTILTVSKIKLLHYLEEKSQRCSFNLGKTLWEPHPSRINLDVMFSGKTFLTFHADLATPFPLTQHTDYSSSVTLNMLLCSYLYFLYLNFLKAKAVFYSPWKSSVASKQ